MTKAKRQAIDEIKEVACECTFKGSTDKRAVQPLESKPTPPTAAFAKQVALSILCGSRGSYRTSGHFAKRMAERGFSIFDMEYVIRNGNCIESGEYSDTHRDHKYTFRGNIDGTDFDAIFSLSVEHHFIESPLMILISGCWKTKSGKRKKSF